jgi:hypothetical protein
VRKEHTCDSQRPPGEHREYKMLGMFDAGALLASRGDAGDVLYASSMGKPAYRFEP